MQFLHRKIIVLLICILSTQQMSSFVFASDSENNTTDFISIGATMVGGAVLLSRQPKEEKILLQKLEGWANSARNISDSFREEARSISEQLSPVQARQKARVLEWRAVLDSKVDPDYAGRLHQIINHGEDAQRYATLDNALKIAEIRAQTAKRASDHLRVMADAIFNMDRRAARDSFSALNIAPVKDTVIGEAHRIVQKSQEKSAGRAKVAKLLFFLAAYDGIALTQYMSSPVVGAEFRIGRNLKNISDTIIPKVTSDYVFSEDNSQKTVLGK